MGPSLLSKFVESIKKTFKRSSKKPNAKPRTPLQSSGDPGPVLVDRMNLGEMARNHTIQALARAESEAKVNSEDGEVHKSMLKEYNAFLQKTRAQLNYPNENYVEQD